MRRCWAAVAALLLCLVGSGYAIRLEIDTGDDPDARLEIRNVTLPDGSEVELFVLTAHPARVRFEGQEIIAEHIEFDATNRLIRVIGFGTFVGETETVEGLDLVVELDDETFRGEDVLIVTETLDVFGNSASRVPGQLSVLAGRFSPCSRCAQVIEDFGFSADRIELFPGDRLVAFGVTVLIRGSPVFDLPLMVLPLGPPDRQPRLEIVQGTETERAEVALDWPYVSGPNAFGTFSVRYFADITPGEGGFFSSRLLGGRVDTSYLGGGVFHRFFTDVGRGDLDLFFMPGFIDDSVERGKTREQFTVRFAYSTEPDLEGVDPVEILVERDDEIRDRILGYRLTASGQAEGVAGTVFTQGFIDFDSEDDVETPVYAGRTVPLRTLTQLTLAPTEAEVLTLGPLRLRDLRADVGAFQDDANPANRSAAATGIASAGRLLEGHTLELTPVNPWSGLELSGRTVFTGQYYSSGERLVDWDSQVQARQRFGRVGEFAVTFRRDINEGETPFVFDQITLRNRTDLQASLRFTPLPWLSLSVEEGYIFQDTRTPDVIGFEPLVSTLSLFDNIRWLSASVSNSATLADNPDPGTLTFRASVSSPDPAFIGNLTVSHIQDLAAEPDRLGGDIVDETETEVSLEFGLPDILRAELMGGYRYRPALPATADDVRAYWLPLELGVTAGTLVQDDFIPGLKVAYSRDLNSRDLTELSYEATARAGPFELSASQRFDIPRQRLGSSSYGVAWPGVVALEGTGFNLVQPEWLGLERDEDATESWTVSLRDNPRNDQERWQITFKTNRDPQLGRDLGTRGLRNSELETRVLLEDVQAGGVRFGVNLFTEILLRDDVLTNTYFRSGNLELQLDLFERVGVQGTLGFLGTFDAGAEEYSSAQLTITEFAVTVRALDDLYLGAILDDVWDFAADDPLKSPWNFQPTIFVVIDRCCWAFYGQWDTETGQIRLVLGAPGSTDGFIQNFDTPLVLPGRQGG